jgi:hypothetical protein
MNITTTKSIRQLSRYERDELTGTLIKKYGITRGLQILDLAERIDLKRKHISASNAINRSVEWFRRLRD